MRVLSLRTRLLRWYDRNKRELPWRTTRDPYHVLVSEMMLQQTRVDVALPYFERWIVRWPSVADLAAADVDDVLAAWSGLGYYRRARALHASAQQIVALHDGVVPADPDALKTLPGVGPYTAAAVASIAYDAAVPVVDGNVERVLCRLLLDDREPSAARKRTLAEASRRLVTALVGEDPAAMEPPEGLRAADWNQAVMELGALVCTPREPRCNECPWRRSCMAHRAGMTAELPRRKSKAPTREVTLHMAFVTHGDRFLLVQRPDGTLLSGMWELPTTSEDGDVASLRDRIATAVGRAVDVSAEPSGSFRHTITNRRITVHVHEAPLGAAHVAEDGSGTAWVRSHDLRDFGVSSMTRKALRAVRG